MKDEFRDWWMSGGSEKWSAALDAEGGTLAALKMVFDIGLASSGINESSRSPIGSTALKPVGYAMKQDILIYKDRVTMYSEQIFGFELIALYTQDQVDEMSRCK